MQRHTANVIESIISGTLTTAVLQRGSVVTLLVLAFVGAGIIGLHNVIDIVLGSNLGTSCTGWIVAKRNVWQWRIFISISLSI